MNQPYVESEYWPERFAREGDAYCFPAGATAGERAEHTLAIIKALEPHLGHYKLLLDFGCGTGRLFPLLSTHTPNGLGYVGADIDEKIIDRACELHGYHFVPIETALPKPFSDFANSRFDCIVAVTVFQHTRDETFEAAAKELRRVAAPGCEVFIIDAGPVDVAPPSHMFPRSPKQIAIELGLLWIETSTLILHGFEHYLLKGRFSAA